MTHLEKHVAAVRYKLYVGLLIDALSWGAAMLCAAGLLLVVIDRLFAVSLPVSWRWPIVFAAVAGCLVVSLFAARVRRPTDQAAAVAIDARLGLAERFSTAIYALPSDELFARAAVSDAEETARRVDLAKQFPLKFGRQWRVAGVLLGLAVAGGVFLPRFDLFRRDAQVAANVKQEAAEHMARADVNKALVMVSSAPNWKNEDELGALIDDFRKLSKSAKIADPEEARRKARKAIELSQAALPNGARETPIGDGSKSAGGFENGEDTRADHSKPTTDKTNGSTSREGSGRPRVAADALAESGINNPNNKTGNANQPGGNQNPQNGNNQAGGNNPAANGANQPGNGNNNVAGNQPGNAQANNNGAGNQQGNGPANNNNGQGVAAAGDRPKQAAPFAVTVEKSPSQDVEGKILARDLIKSRALVGEQTTKLAKVMQAAREEAADEIDAEHVSGPAQSAARKYFRTMEETR